MENLDLREILKDVPKGTILYSTTHGNIRFDGIDQTSELYPVHCHDIHGTGLGFTKDGRWNANCQGECVLFPSKEQREWSKFELPCQFNNGDILTNKNGNYITIFYKADCIPGFTTTDTLYYHCFYDKMYKQLKSHKDYGIGTIRDYRKATKEEEQLLLNKLQDFGYFWNHNNKSLERYKFKVGDVIQNVKTKNIYTILKIEHDFYYISIDGKYTCAALCCVDQDEWESYQEKFDITTLKPYDKVLARYSNDSVWRPQIFSYLDINLEHNNYKFVIVGLYSIPQCIPYEGNEHLIGTNNECDEYYKTWE